MHIKTSNLDCYISELRTLIFQREDENAYYRNFCVETELYKLLDQLGNDPDDD